MRLTLPQPGQSRSRSPIDPKTYLIGPEDILKVEVNREPELLRLVNVRPDGKITLLRIGDLQAEGLTPERLTAQVKEAYSQTIIDPEVTISVMAVNSKAFTVTGKVNKTGRFALVTPLRVFDALQVWPGAFRSSPTYRRRSRSCAAAIACTSTTTTT